MLTFVYTCLLEMIWKQILILINHFYSNHSHAMEAGMTGHDIRCVIYQQLDNEAISDEQSIISHGAINGITTMWCKLLQRPADRSASCIHDF